MSKRIKLYLGLIIFIIAVFLAFPQDSYAVFIFGDGLLGHFNGDFTYSAADTRLTITLTNTSPAANGGFIVGFSFNNPSNLISSVVALNTSDPDFGVAGGPGYNNSVGESPFGQFDIGAEISGSPLQGIGVGATETFVFNFTGTNLNTLNESIFLSTLSSPHGDGEGVQPFVVRFQGFEDGDSDKVPLVPEPTTMLLFGIGALGLGINKFKKERR